MWGCEIDLFGSVGRPDDGDYIQGNETCGFDTIHWILWPYGRLLASEKEVCSMALVLYDQDKLSSLDIRASVPGLPLWLKRGLFVNLSIIRHRVCMEGPNMFLAMPYLFYVKTYDPYEFRPICYEGVWDV